MCSCQSILECCVTFSGVKLSIRSFVLFIASIFISISLSCNLKNQMNVKYFIIRQNCNFRQYILIN